MARSLELEARKSRDQHRDLSWRQAAQAEPTVRRDKPGEVVCHRREQRSVNIGDHGVVDPLELSYGRLRELGRMVDPVHGRISIGGHETSRVDVDPICSVGTKTRCSDGKNAAPATDISDRLATFQAFAEFLKHENGCRMITRSETGARIDLDNGRTIAIRLRPRKTDRQPVADHCRPISIVPANRMRFVGRAKHRRDTTNTKISDELPGEGVIDHPDPCHRPAWAQHCPSGTTREVPADISDLFCCGGDNHRCAAGRHGPTLVPADQRAILEPFPIEVGGRQAHWTRYGTPAPAFAWRTQSRSRQPG